MATILQTLDILRSGATLRQYNGPTEIIRETTLATEGITFHETKNVKNGKETKKPSKRISTDKSSNYTMVVSTEKNISVNIKKQKVSHIGFLKVHKAGSTTMQNIFFRYGLKYNLTFVLPKRGHYFLSTDSAMPVKAGNHRDILACHSVYSRKLFGSVLPEDSVNIGIIREPLERMISAAYYYRDVWKSPSLVKVPRANFIHNLINHPELYEPEPFTKTKNTMGKDFGFAPSTKINDTGVIEKHFALLKIDFKLILVMERFDESLILMKRTLNWDLSDIIYLKTNSHAHQAVVLSPGELKTFKSTCFLDYAVYETFYEVFDKKVKGEGHFFMKEVKFFQSVLELVKDFCNDSFVKQSHRPLIIERSIWSEPFEVTFHDCYYMKMKELKFVDFLKKRHLAMNME